MCDDCIITPPSSIKWVFLNFLTGLLGVTVFVGGYSAYMWGCERFRAARGA